MTNKSILDIYIPILNFLQKNSDFQFKKNEINDILSRSLDKTKEWRLRLEGLNF